jgi:predicted MFS family arabinose efflux permease
MVQVVGNALGAIIGSIFYDLRGDYLLTFAVFGVIAGVAAVFVGLARPPKLTSPSSNNPAPEETPEQPEAESDA